jgi:hypothetical protein
LWVLSLTHISEDKNKTQEEKKILDTMDSIFEELLKPKYYEKNFIIFFIINTTMLLLGSDI